MAQDKYIHRSNLHQSLAHFIEECGEALAAAGKVQRFGWLGVNPELPDGEEKETNMEWLLREMIDLEGAMERLRKQVRKTYK